MVLTIGGGSERPGRLRLGHFAAERWVGEEGSTVSELFIGGEGLRSGADELLDTVLHEAAHGLAHARGIKDTSRQGRWHNSRYRDVAVELGLEVDKDDSLGWSTTTLTAATKASYAEVLAQLAEVVTTYRRPDVHGDRSNSNNPIAMSCQCPRKIRASRTVAAAGPIVCTLCRQPFLADEDASEP